MKHTPILGQHWLVDQIVLAKIVYITNIVNNDIIFEIGTGKGHLTDKLLDSKAKQIISLEYDKKIYSKNIAKYQSANKLRLQLINSDIRKYDWNQLPQTYKVCANIPYYLTANLLRILVDISNKPTLVVLLIAQEIAHKIADTQKRSFLTMIVQSQYEVELSIVVPAIAFEPPPKVVSQLVILSPKPIFSDFNDQQYLKLIQLFKISFANPRKKLINNLKSQITLDNLEQQFNMAEIDINIRAERLSNQQWYKLFKLLENYL